MKKNEKTERKKSKKGRNGKSGNTKKKNWGNGVCVVCGTVFPKQGQMQKYCSDDCKDARDYYSEQKYKKQKKIDCPYENGLVLPVYGDEYK